MMPSFLSQPLPASEHPEPAFANSTPTDNDADAGGVAWIVDEDPSPTGIVELLLKAPAALDRMLRCETQLADLIPRFLLIGVTCLTLYGLLLWGILELAGAAAPGWLADSVHARPWRSSLAMALAFGFGFVATIGVCLPSFYFYGLLAGIRASMLQVTAQMLKSFTATALVLVGVVPIYVAAVLGVMVFRLPHLQLLLNVGLVLPFVAGLWGMVSLYRGFHGFVDTLEESRRCRRECFLRRLVLSCTFNFGVVGPVMVYTVWNYLANTL